MSILTELDKYRNYKCNICKSTETLMDKKKNKARWYKTWVDGEAGFWCYTCYKYVFNQTKVIGSEWE